MKLSRHFQIQFRLKLTKIALKLTGSNRTTIQQTFRLICFCFYKMHI